MWQTDFIENDSEKRAMSYEDVSKNDGSQYIHGEWTLCIVIAFP